MARQPGLARVEGTAGDRGMSHVLAIPATREASFDDYAAIAELERANGLKSRPKAHWIRMWQGNPAYHAGFPMGWVMEDEDTGKITGTISNIPLAYTLQGRSVLAATGRGWAVDPSVRAFAPLLFDEYLNQPVDLLLSTTVNGLAEASHTICEQTRVPVGDWTQAAFRITNYSGFAASALRIKGLPELLRLPVACGLWAKDRVAGAAMPKAPSNTPVELHSDFSEAFDRFWEELVALKWNKLLAVRSRAALRWHFGPAIDSGAVRVLQVVEAGRMLGYCVLLRCDHEASGLLRYRVADAQWLTGDPRVAAALTHAAVETAVNDGVHVLETVGLNIPQTASFQQAAGYRRKLPAWSYFYHSNDAALMDALSAPSVWEPSSFDGDSSI